MMRDVYNDSTGAFVKGMYRLDEQKNPVPVKSLREFGVAFEADRQVASEYVGDIKISTVFLGIDHGFDPTGSPDYKPVLFETMIFNGPLDQECIRYCTWDEAMAGHIRTVHNVRISQRWHVRLWDWIRSITSLFGKEK